MAQECDPPAVKLTQPVPGTGWGWARMEGAKSVAGTNTPSCPSSSAPKQCKVWSVFSAQVWNAPATTVLQSLSLSTWAGSLTWVIDCPDSSEPFDPQHQSVPS